MKAWVLEHLRKLVTSALGFSVWDGTLFFLLWNLSRRKAAGEGSECRVDGARA